MGPLAPHFVTQVYNLLRLIGVPEHVAERETAEMQEVEFAKTASRSVLGSLNEISLHRARTSAQAVPIRGG